MGLYAFEWGKLLTCHLKGNWQMVRILIILKTNSPRTSSAPALGLNTIIFKVQVGKYQEKAQSEKDSHSKNRGGKKLN